MKPHWHTLYSHVNMSHFLSNTIGCFVILYPEILHNTAVGSHKSTQEWSVMSLFGCDCGRGQKYCSKGAEGAGAPGRERDRPLHMNNWKVCALRLSPWWAPADEPSRTICWNVEHTLDNLWRNTPQLNTTEYETRALLHRSPGLKQSQTAELYPCYNARLSNHVSFHIASTADHFWLIFENFPPLNQQRIGLLVCSEIKAEVPV